MASTLISGVVNKPSTPVGTMSWLTTTVPTVDQCSFLSEYFLNVASHISNPLLTLYRYGCNEVTPRLFSEVQTLYSNDMIDVFSGGLIYEFTQEPNNYGLVEVDESSGEVRLTQDYLLLKSQLQQLPALDQRRISMNMKQTLKDAQSKAKLLKSGPPKCASSYENLDTSKGLPVSIADGLIDDGVDVVGGKYVALSEEQLKTSFKYFKPNGEEYAVKPSIRRAVDYMGGTDDTTTRDLVQGLANCTYNDSDPRHHKGIGGVDEAREFGETILAAARSSRGAGLLSKNRVAHLLTKFKSMFARHNSPSGHKN